jgi:enamine deaminase RidA (YjgF/YER057c/UK114 family)
MRGLTTLAAAAALLGVLPAHADDCSTLMTAMMNQASKPYNATVTMSDPTGKNHTSKIIFTGSLLYTQVEGQWHSMQLTSKEMADQIRDAAKTAKTSCHQTGAEAVNGQPATIYMAHVENQGSISDNKVWVSKANGATLKSEVTIKDGPHMVTVFDYGKIVPPANATPLVAPPQH